jgi:hypothetical protein
MSSKGVYDGRCKWCPGDKMRVQLEPLGSKHWARAVCTTCGKFDRWLPHPKNVKANDPRAGAIMTYNVMVDKVPLVVGNRAPIALQ